MVCSYFWHRYSASGHLITCGAFASALVGILFCSNVFGLDESRLWLAKAHHKYHLDLVRAAHAAEALERCESVVEGTLDLEQSRPNHPYFRILCRQENGRSYNEMVDGLSFKTLTTVVVEKPEPTEEEIALLRAQEEARKQAELEDRKAMAWRACTEQLQQEARMMSDLVVITQAQPEPNSLTDSEIIFITAFDAKDMWGKKLQFQAICTVTDEGLASTVLGKRQASSAPAE